jgi:hypothetical protein
LVALGVSPFLIHLWQMVGKARIRVHGTLYEPDPTGGIAFLTPVLTHHIDTPESPEPWGACRFGNLIDLCAWHPRHPHLWALRADNATWLGAIPPQYLQPDPTVVWRSPGNWLRADCEGLVLLSPDRAEAYRILSGCVGGIIAEDQSHARDLRQILQRPWQGPTVTVAPNVALVARHAA